MLITKKISFAQLTVLWEYIQFPKLMYKNKMISDEMVILIECIFDKGSQKFSVSVNIAEEIDNGIPAPKEFVREILKTLSGILDILPGDDDAKISPSNDEDERSTQ